METPQGGHTRGHEGRGECRGIPAPSPRVCEGQRQQKENRGRACRWEEQASVRRTRRHAYAGTARSRPCDEADGGLLVPRPSRKRRHVLPHEGYPCPDTLAAQRLPPPHAVVPLTQETVLRHQPLRTRRPLHDRRHPLRPSRRALGEVRPRLLVEKIPHIPQGGDRLRHADPLPPRHGLGRLPPHERTRRPRLEPRVQQLHLCGGRDRRPRFRPQGNLTREERHPPHVPWQTLHPLPPPDNRPRPGHALHETRRKGMHLAAIP